MADLDLAGPILFVLLFGTLLLCRESSVWLHLWGWIVWNNRFTLFIQIYEQ